MSATPDFAIQRRILETLCNLAGLTLAEEILIDEISNRLPRRPDAQAIRDQLAIMKRNGLAETTTGPLREPRWRRTPAGEAALKDLET
jgi:predicted transcriptional regulator